MQSVREVEEQKEIEMLKGRMKEFGFVIFESKRTDHEPLRKELKKVGFNVVMIFLWQEDISKDIMADDAKKIIALDYFRDKAKESVGNWLGGSFMKAHPNPTNSELANFSKHLRMLKLHWSEERTPEKAERDQKAAIERWKAKKRRERQAQEQIAEYLKKRM